MSKSENGSSEMTALLMLSGGRDSFLSACRLFFKGYNLHLVTYDNGCMLAPHNALAVAEYLVQRYGKDRVCTYSVDGIAQEVGCLRSAAEESESLEIARKYPHLLYSQLNCLICHTVMYLHSIAYCKAKNINVIAEGAREEQKFFVELPEMKQRYETLCKKHGIELLLPVYNLKSDLVRKKELMRWGMVPKPSEPQCVIGCPMKAELTREQRESLTAYYDAEIAPKADELIDELVPFKQSAESSLNAYIGKLEDIF